ncbi:RusA family crossover junction endodeoxyribonuclease [Nostoc sp.]|uniref:RusA family crossover junction endodeoxyribonuclease n=1 Tax=Nostoc sp. TaxID=1180 RepID=UPI003593FFCE
MTRFEFIVDGPPVSQQNRDRGKGNRREAWQNTVKQEAKKYWSSEQKIATGWVMLQITYFYDSDQMDVDNIVKPIQDAMKGIAYVDDKQVSDLLVRKRNLLDLRKKDTTSILAEGFARGKEFLHIVVIDAPNQEVST